MKPFYPKKLMLPIVLMGKQRYSGGATSMRQRVIYPDGKCFYRTGIQDNFYRSCFCQNDLHLTLLSMEAHDNPRDITVKARPFRFWERIYYYFKDLRVTEQTQIPY